MAGRPTALTEKLRMTDNDLHPRPQLARDRWIDLSGPWGFAYDDADGGLDECWFERSDPFGRTVLVPFPPESRASGIGDSGYHPVAWYRRTVQIPPSDRRGQLMLHFGARSEERRVGKGRRSRWASNH